MKKEIANRWIVALESGEYKQTQKLLYDGKGFCCLGVLTDLYRKEHGGEWIVDPIGEFSYPTRADTHVLSKEVMDWSGVQDRVGRIPSNIGDLGSRSLAEMNDGGASFQQIANTIRKHSEEL